MFIFKFTMLQMDNFKMSLEGTVTGELKATNITVYVGLKIFSKTELEFVDRQAFASI